MIIDTNIIIISCAARSGNNSIISPVSRGTSACRRTNLSAVCIYSSGSMISNCTNMRSSIAWNCATCYPTCKCATTIFVLPRPMQVICGWILKKSKSSIVRWCHQRLIGSSEFRRNLYGLFLGCASARCFGVAKTE